MPLSCLAARFSENPPLKPHDQVARGVPLKDQVDELHGVSFIPDSFHPAILGRRLGFDPFGGDDILGHRYRSKLLLEFGPDLQRGVPYGCEHGGITRSVFGPPFLLGSGRLKRISKPLAFVALKVFSFCVDN